MRSSSPMSEHTFSNQCSWQRGRRVPVFQPQVTKWVPYRDFRLPRLSTACSPSRGTAPGIVHVGWKTTDPIPATRNVFNHSSLSNSDKRKMQPRFFPLTVVNSQASQSEKFPDAIALTLFFPGDLKQYRPGLGLLHKKYLLNYPATTWPTLPPALNSQDRGFFSRN
jgi:hypothetical protein